MDKCKAIQSGVGHCRSKGCLAPPETTERSLGSACGDWKRAENFCNSRDVRVHCTDMFQCYEARRQTAVSVVF